MERTLRMPDGTEVTGEVEGFEDGDPVIGLVVTMLDGTKNAYTKGPNGEPVQYEIDPSGALLIQNGLGQTRTAFGPAAWSQFNVALD